ncbi:MAG: response regulator transcription factor [Ruminococcus sp.]|nr:response regulator transcription factor [Ruminococcus sp.]
MAYKVLIADDQKMVRQMFELAVKSSENYELAGMAETPERAVELCLARKIDIVLMDVVMGSGMDGLDAAKEIKEQRPETKILLVTSMPEVSYIERARAVGVESFWHKEVQELPLLEIMDRTMAGESVYPLSMPAVRFGNIISTELTDTEFAVLRELVAGASNKEIGERLYMSASTVKRHISDILGKTGFKTRLQLAIKARGGGLVINNRDIEADE